MTPEQRNRLLDLIKGMKANARRAVSQNDHNKAWHWVGIVERRLSCDYVEDEMDQPPIDELLAIAEKAAQGADKPGTIRMPSLAAVLSGMPPEVKP